MDVSLDRVLLRRNNSEFQEHFVDDGEKGRFHHGAALDAFVDRDDFVEFLYLFALIEAIEKKLDFVFELRRERVSLCAWHASTGAGADCDELLGFGADFFESFFLLDGVYRTFDKGDVELVEHVLGLEDACMADIEHFSPGFEMIVHELGKNHGAVFAAGESEPTDSKFPRCSIHNTGMVA